MDPVYEEDLPRLLASNLAYYEVFYKFFRDWLFHVAWRLVGNPDDAEELVQETFRLVLMALRRKTAEEIEKIKFRPYLTRAATNCYINSCRKKHVQTVSLDAPGNMALLELLEDMFFEQPEISLEHKEMSQRLYVLLQNLPVEYRVVVQLKHIRELNVTEIARVLGISHYKVKDRLSKGMDMLKAAALDNGYQHVECIERQPWITITDTP